MKKTIIMLIIFLLSVTLVGCDPNNNNDTDLSFELKGNKNITIMQGETYTDEGYTINKDLHVVKESTVDTNIPGTYSVVYTVEFEDDLYTITRTVVVEEEQFERTFSLNTGSIEVSYDSIKFRVQYWDDDNQVNNITIFFKDGDTLLEQITVTSNDFEYTFLNLESDYVYRTCVVVEYFNGTEDEEFHGGCVNTTTDVFSLPTVKLVTASSTENSVTYDLDFSEGLSNTSCDLFQGNMMILTQPCNETNSTITFNGLESNTAYTLRVNFEYVDMVTNQTVSETNILLPISTDAQTVYVEPSILVTNQSAGETEMIIDFTLTGDVSNITCGLYTGGTLVENATCEKGANSFYFINLQPNTNYHMSITYDYFDTTNQSVSDTVIFGETTTLNQVSQIPVFDNLEVTVLNDVVVLDYDFSDPVYSLDEANVYIYDDLGNVVTSSMFTHLDKMEFNSLSTTGIYTLKLIYSYTDKSDNTYYEDVVLFEEDFAYINEFNVIDLYAPLHINLNEEAEFNLNFNNPEGLVISEISINDTVFNTITSNQDYTTLMMNLGFQTEVGQMMIEVDYVELIINGEVQRIYLNDVLYLDIYKDVQSVPNNATIDILKVESNIDVVDINVTNIVTVDVYLTNIYDLDYFNVHVNGVVLSYEDYYRHSPTHFSFEYTITEGKNQIEIEEIDFNKGATLTQYTQDLCNSAYVYGYEQQDIIYISTPLELSNLSQANGVYFLENDIDMTGYNMYIESNTELIYGNGYKITNASKNQSIGNLSSIGSLFNYGLILVNSGYIIDLEFENIDLNYTNTYLDNDLQIGIIGENYGVINDLSVTGTSTLQVDGLGYGVIGGVVGVNRGVMSDIKADNYTVTANYASTSYLHNDSSIGGIVGIMINSSLNKSSFKGTVNVSSSLSSSVGYFTGALVGDMRSSLIQNSYTRFYINASGPIATGGLVGGTGRGLYNGNIIRYSYAKGTINANNNTAGLVASISYGNYTYSNFTVVDIYNIGQSYNGSVGYLTVHQHDHVTNVNNYYYSGVTIVFMNDSDPAISDANYSFAYDTTLEQFNNSSFLTDEINLSEHIYDFTTLDVPNNVYPIHKN